MSAASSATAAFAIPRSRVTSASILALGGLVFLFAWNALLNPPGVQVSVSDFGRVVLHHTPILNANPHATPAEWIDSIVWQVRMPRAVAGALIGALLACAGMALQGLLLNPLADPYTVGVSAGAALGAAGAEVLGISALAFGFAGAGIAFASALGAVATVYALARISGRVSVHTILLAGVVVGTFLWSLIPLLLVLTGRMQDMRRLLFYLIGSIQYTDWPRAWLLAPILVVTLISLRAWARDLNIMSFGEESAAHLGVDIERLKKRVLLVTSLATAAAVSVGGIIGFVGLIVPHVARRIVGPDHRAVLPLAATLGACLVVASDMLVRVYLSEMPVGIVTSLVGAPFFCYLLRKRHAVAW